MTNTKQYFKSLIIKDFSLDLGKSRIYNFPKELISKTELKFNISYEAKNSNNGAYVYNYYINNFILNGPDKKTLLVFSDTENYAKNNNYEGNFSHIIFKIKNMVNILYCSFILSDSQKFETFFHGFLLSQYSNYFGNMRSIYSIVF